MGCASSSGSDAPHHMQTNDNKDFEIQRKGLYITITSLRNLLLLLLLNRSLSDVNDKSRSVYTV